MLSGYVMEGIVRKLNSTLKVVDLTPTAAAIENPREFDMAAARIPAVAWGMSREGIVGVEGRPLATEESGAMEFLRYRRDVLRQEMPPHLRPGQPAPGLGPGQPARELRGQGPLRRRLQQDPGLPEPQDRGAPLRQRHLEGPRLCRARRNPGHGRHDGELEPVLRVGERRHRPAAEPDRGAERHPVRRGDQRHQGQESGLFLTLLSVFCPLSRSPRGGGPFTLSRRRG